MEQNTGQTPTEANDRVLLTQLGP